MADADKVSQLTFCDLSAAGAPEKMSVYDGI